MGRGKEKHSDGDLSRRRVLSMTAAAGIGGVAGCVTSSPGGEQSSRDDASTPEPTETAGTPTSGRTPNSRPGVLHVSVAGADTNPGTETEPLASIQAAIDRAGPGDTVYVHPGEYRENVRIRDGGEPGAPLTLTGPADAVLKPKRENEWEALGVGASHVRVTGLTFSGLYDPDEPENAQSYAKTHLVYLNTNATETGYLEGLVVSPHRIGYAGGALINSKRIKDSAIGGFEVIGPAGAGWLFSERDGHYGEVVYLGTAADKLVERGNFEDYDHTRNVRVHHIDNSAGHPHSELVDCKTGTRNITVEYCTDAGGVQSDDSYWSQAIALGGRDCTVRWNVVRDAMGSGVGIGPVGFKSKFENDSGNGAYLTEPRTEKERRMGKGHAVYGNVFTGNSADAIDFVRESYRPGRDSNPLPEDQRALCGNLFDGYSDGAPDSACPSGLPAGDGVGHLGGESPWSGTAATKGGAFSRHAARPDLDVSVRARDVPAETTIEATVTVTNTGEGSESVTVRLRDRGYLLADETAAVPAGGTRDVRCTSGGLEAPAEVSVTLNGQKIERVRVVDAT
jgi:hypothetical protein